MDGNKKTILDDRRLFIISDLHIGDGSSRDNLMKDDKLALFHHFLDEVEKCDGALLILGDFLELWRYSWTAVMQQWDGLFNRLSGMHVVYVPGNHDDLLDGRFAECRQSHAFFETLHRPFMKTIGGKRFKFMHGHEVDPLISRYCTTFAPVLRLLAGTLEFRSDRCLVTCDKVSDVLLEAGEQALRLWHLLTRQVNHAVHAHLGFPTESMTWLKCPLRTRNMLARFYKQQQAGFYDVTITGHTHNAGYFGNWYYNSGCWTRNVMNYLMIDPDGRIEIRNWTADGSAINSATVA